MSQFWKQQFTFGLVIFVCSFLLLAPKSALSATQNISFNCSANSFQAPSVPGDILVITLTAACKTQNTNYGTNVTLNSIVSSTGVSKTIATSTLYSVGDVFTYTVGTAVGTNTNAGFSNTAGSSYYGVYAATPSIPNVTAISPTSGSANGGTSVTITSSSSRSFQTLGTGGAWVSVVTDVTIGGVAVQSYSVTSDTTLTAVTPAGSVGTASVVVTNTVGSNSANTLYTYVEPPTATSNSPAAQNLTLTGAMTNITPLTGSGGTAPLTYYVSSGTLPSGISLNATTGVISGTPTATYSTANVVIAVKDANNIPASTTSSVSFTVAARPTRTASDTTSRTLAVGLPISSFTPITGTGGTAPLNYFISSGTLPSGLTLNSTTGLVSGTPTAIYSAASVVFGVKDANNITPSSSSTSSVSFTVNKGSQTISYTSSAPSSATVGGDTYTPVATSTSGLALTLTIDATSTTVCSITGGVVTLIGSGTCKINANQSGNVDYNAAAQVQQSFTVSARPTATASTTAQSLTAGTAMTSFTPLTGSGGVSPLTYYISSGTLPAGLSLSSSTGAVTGTPSGAFAASNIVFAVKDVNNSVATTTSTVSFTVNLVTPVLSGFSLSSNNLVFGSSAPTITAPTSASSGAITYSSSNLGVATVSGSTITIVGVGTTTLTATQAANGNYDTANTTATLTITASTDANLSGMTLSSGALTPTFASSTFAYTQSVANGVSSITVTPTVNQANATVTVNGTAVTSGSASGSISLNVGTNTITTVVTAQDGTTTQTYTTTVTRAAAASTDANLSGLTLSSGAITPTFASSTINYTQSVAYGVSSITVTPTINQANATVTVNGTAVTSGSASGSISLSVGTNTITTVVTAQDGTTTKTYTTTVTRAAASTDATLSGMTLSSGALTPTFASSTFAYTQSVANAVSSITVTPTVNQANATVTVNGTAVTSGSASGSISLSVGTNTITTVVTAQDGTTTQTYTTTVTRAAALISQASFSVTASPNALNATTTTSALSTTGGSGTGSVTYAMTSGTCTLSGSTVTAGTANETCTVTATKAADSTYLAATATVNITVSRRASLASAATDPSVARMQAVQLAQSKLFVQNQIENVTSHLDNYRHSFKLMPSRMGITINTPSLGPMSPVFYKVKDAWAGNTALANDPSMQKVGMKDATPTTMGEKIYNDYVKHEPIDEQTHNEEAPAAFERTQGSYSLWSTGSVDTGLFKTGDNNDQSNKFRLNGLTFGLDYKLGPRAIMGAALGLSQGSSKAQELDGSVKSNQQSVKGYGLLGFGDGWVVDGLLGQSRHSFTGDRTTSGGAATLGMSRNGDSTFASSSIRKIVSYRSFRLALFVRQDITHIRLNPYNETGAADYALGYDKAKYTATATSAGLHLLSDFYLDRGKLTTSAKLSANRMRTSSISQDIYYADSGIAGGIYTLQQSSSQQNLPSLSLGISYTNKAGDGIDFGWIGAIGSNQNKLNGLRLGLRFAM